MEKINYIDIGFENCDSCTIPIKENPDLLNFWICKVNESAMSVNLNEEFYTMKVAEEIRLNFSKDALEIKSSWDKLNSFGNTLKEHLNFRDITSVRICYGKNKSVEYHVLYQEENEAELGSPNIYQTNEFLSDGGCNVTIKKRRSYERKIK